MEYGLDDSLHIYCGGLGILAGDYLKAAKDLGLPVVGIGILWRQDYTNQYVGVDGWPYDIYKTYDFDFLKDTGVTIQVRVRGTDVTCKVWKADQFENAPLYLLDAGYPDTPNGWMTSKLYGGVEQDRLANEIILGIGGVRALRALGIDVDLYHFNEGHAVFAGFELIREKMALGMDFEKALNTTRKEIIFTTHTPVMAGNESHDIGLIQYMEANNGLNYEQLKRLGDDPFNMTIAGLRMAYLANGVSKLHTKTANRMWEHIQDRARIICITNGVHVKTWQDPRIRLAYERNEDLWQPHMEIKKELIQFVKDITGRELNPETLTIGFARRAAPYKRGELIFRNADAIEPLFREGKLQLIFSGKAHPNDNPGKEIVQKLVQMSRKYPENVIFLENYDMSICKHLISGCDIWLNNPKRPLEASGTSGMKAAVNGVLNLSVVDGWVAEGPEHEVSGWLIDEVFKSLPEKETEDEKDLQALYHLLYENVIPTYYKDRERWVNMMRASIEMASYQFSAQRMIKDYYEKMYKPAYQAQKESAVTV
ncbi:alpha-glucan phosphorylase [Anoxybacter fermentans]|uniref:Alpha-glucan phosphorylase n=2 Tax=Anoxybacter fermentans TaxID=1323375 RepID=A0A3S9T2X4_9FIRM|nr:alpha-glucan phosphorylase [Anoxybacter fermentans]